MGSDPTLGIGSQWNQLDGVVMLATLSGDICLLFGLALLLLPLMAVELSRPRDGVWGAVVLLLGLVLVTSSDRLRGAPMLAVLCGSLLISRLSAEVGQSRWQALDDDERQRLGSREYWLTGLQQLGTAASSLSSGLSGAAKQLKPTAKSGVSGKKWVRPDQAASPDLDASSKPMTEATQSTEAAEAEVAQPEIVTEPEIVTKPDVVSESKTVAEPQD